MKMFTNLDTEYALAAKLIHWISALTVFGLFGLGLWMTSLDYYDPWYQKGPELHISIGVLLACLTLMRILYRSVARFPAALPAPRWQMLLAKLVHIAFYLLLLSMFVTGYLVVTAKGEALAVFDWLHIPAVVTGIDNLEDTMGDIHEWLAYVIIALAGLHIAGALKHQFIDKDGTLSRMISRIK